MLFAFNNFWKIALIFLSAWALYGLCGYEFTLITIMAAILVQLSTSPHNE
tara:strand:- start:214 stop:363 length:150 start_codon:yes stop_codon:yes gene_type:complete